MTQLGFYGKIPQRGDFVRFNLPQTFVTVWDEWWQELLFASHDAEHEDPAEPDPLVRGRFAWSSGLAGDHGWFGVSLPSADKVGRRFPFCIAVSVPFDRPTCAILEREATMLDRLDRLAAEVFDDGDLDRLKAALKLEAAEPQAESDDAQSRMRMPDPIAEDESRLALRVRSSIDGPTGAGDPIVVDALLRLAHWQYSAWHTTDRESARQELLLTGGLPDRAMLSNSGAGSATAVVELTRTDPPPAGTSGSPMRTLQTPMADRPRSTGAGEPLTAAELTNSDWSALDDFSRDAIDERPLAEPVVEKLEIDDEGHSEVPPWER